MTDSLHSEAVHKGREVLYSALSKIFLDMPCENMYKMLESIMPMLIEMKTDNEEDKLLNEGIKGLENFIIRRNQLDSQNRKEFDEDMERAYTSLYCLGDAVPVSESVYLSIDHMVMQEQEIAVESIYNSCGFKMQSTSNEPQDHISYELMFMSFLSKGIAKCISNNDLDSADKFIEIQRSFLQDHLLKWIEEFVKAMLLMQASYNFYLPAAYLTAGFVKIDFDFLSE